MNLNDLWRIAVIFSVLPLLAVSGCSKETDESAAAVAQQATPSVPSVLVSVEWLVGARQTPGVIVVDARPAAEYADGHIDGAVNLPIHLTTVSANPGESNLAPVNQIQDVLGRAGIDMARPVVVYDEATDYRAAAQLFWVLELHGHPAVAVLDGGFAAWKKQDGPITKTPTRPTPTRFIANVQPRRLATKLAVAQAVKDPNVVIIDSRSTAEYLGEKSQAARAGHIPSAVHIDAGSTLLRSGDYCQLKAPHELTPLFAGLPEKSRIITYCNTGRSAAINYLALRRMNRDVAVYDGSWMEWGNDRSLPVECPAPPPSTRPTAQADPGNGK